MKIKRLPRLNSIPNKLNIGNKIKKYRLECGLTQKELAIEIGYKSAVAINLIESNKRGIDVERLNRICNTCGIKIIEIL